MKDPILVKRRGGWEVAIPEREGWLREFFVSYAAAKARADRALAEAGVRSTPRVRCGVPR